MRQSLRRLFSVLVSFFLRYRGEFIVSVAAGIFLAILFFFVGSLGDLIEQGSRFEANLLLIQLAIIALVFVLLFNFRRLFNKQIDAASNLFYDFFGYAWQSNQYFRRKQHFVLEKDTLCHILVNDVLPRLLDEIEAKPERPVGTCNILIDSGTTLSPAFRYLPTATFARDRELKIKIHTNNIAGTEELNRVDDREWRLAETDFFLIDGNPLGRYRATTYEGRPHPYLKNLWAAAKDSGVLNVGVITGNWILAGADLTRLTICAKGRGHPEFKEELVENCDYLVVVAPLGKILRLGDVSDLNELLPQDEGRYRAISIAKDKREFTFLLTTVRGGTRRSPLGVHSANLQDKMMLEAQGKRVTENFRFCQGIPEFNPPGAREEVLRIEVPHKYLRGRNFRAAYGYELWT